MTSLIAMIIAVPVGLGIAIFLTELCPPGLASADRHRDRIARRHSFNHLRHLGLFHLDAVLRPDAADRLADSGDHGSALHHRDFPRCLRHRPAGPERGGVSASAARHGKWRSNVVLPYTQGWRGRRRDAGPWPRAWRDDGGDFRHRQFARDRRVAAVAGDDDFGDHRQRIPGIGRASIAPRCWSSACSCSSSPSSFWPRRESC